MVHNLLQELLYLINIILIVVVLGFQVGTLLLLLFITVVVFGIPSRNPIIIVFIVMCLGFHVGNPIFAARVRCMMDSLCENPFVWFLVDFGIWFT